MAAKSPVVQTVQGQVQGVEGTALNGDKFYKYFAIPFAKAPVGELRFKDPLPAESWQGIRDCLEPGDPSVQRNETGHIIGTEDCLHLNVYTKGVAQESATKALKPVMVFIHGGGFVTGSNQPVFYAPEYLMSEDILLVTINYRLGLLGLLRIKDQNNETIGGNMALKDQVEALKWVKNNIANFGGDPNNVTIFGESAGAASVHYHVLSPKSRGYFHKAIMQSGVALNPWADAGQEFDDFSASQIAKFAGHDGLNETEAVKVLQNLSPEEIIQVQVKFAKQTRTGMIRPCVEKPSESAFLSKKPVELVASGEYNKVPMIFGYNDMEGMLFFAPGFKSGELNIKNKIPYNAETNTINKMVDKVEKFYFGEGKNKTQGEMDMYTYADFVYGIIFSVKNHGRTNCCPVYLYKMTLDSSLNFFKKMFQLTQFSGASHADDLGYLFNTLINPDIEPNSPEHEQIQYFVKMWTNFAKYGNPTPPNNDLNINWPSISKDELDTLIIDKKLKLTVNPDKERIKLWSEVYQEYPNSAWSKTLSKL